MLAKDESHPITGFVENMLFSVKIESVAQDLGFRVIWFTREMFIKIPDSNTSYHQFGEHLEGPGAELIDEITLIHPAMMIFDVSDSLIAWKTWVALIKSAPATRRIPLVCFGPHVDVDLFRSLRNAGADGVVARSRFLNDLPSFIERFARVPNYDKIMDSCETPLSDLAIKGLELFNKGEYFEAHEVLEEAWKEDATPARELYRAILQIAVAYLQIERGNYQGAMKMFLRVRQWIAPLPDLCRGVNIAQLKSDASEIHDDLACLGKDSISEFDTGIFKPVIYSVS